jgi:hypothetical protein
MPVLPKPTREIKEPLTPSENRMSTSNQTARPDASIVPIEGPAQAPSIADDFRTAGTASDALAARPAHLPSSFSSAPFGANNEQLPERLQSALRRIVQQFGTESESTRRQEIRRIKQAHQFWRGLQYLWWSERDQNWHLPFEQKLTDGSSIEDLPRYEFVTNIYQAFGLSIVSVLSQDVPRVRFFPSSAQAEEDVSAAKAATEVAQLVERNNRIGNLIVDEAFNLWTDGKVGAYVRFVVDGQRFGFHPETEIAAREVKIGEDVYVCPNCGTDMECGGLPPLSHDGARSVAANEASLAQEKAGASSRTPHDVTCTACGAFLTSENFVAAETVTVPSVETRLRVPNGQEVITIVGGLELKTPPWAGEMHEYPYLQWNMEVHQARLRAAYPHAADKIGSPVATGSQEYERLARLAQSQGGPLTEGGDFNINLITFQRTWLRPWAFFALDDKSLRDELLQLFPDGAYVAFAGETYCESRNENMDDHWRVLHALPGDGSSGRPALGDALISVQERFNTLSNLQIETYEYGIPPIYADSEVLDFDALQNQTAEPGAHYPARSKPGQSLAAGFFQPAPAEVPPDLAEHAANLMGPVAQFLTGAFPALFGGAMANNDTAAGYAMARDQAMGRISLVWRRMKFFHADVMLLAVDCFRRNRPNDVEVTLLGAGAAFESRWIRLADLKGNLFSYPETDEQYPTLWSQQRGVLLQLLGSPDPAMQAVLSHPENLALVKRLIGLEELVIPDEESRTKQYREIAQLVAESPVMKISDAPPTSKVGARHAVPERANSTFAPHQHNLATTVFGSPASTDPTTTPNGTPLPSSNAGHGSAVPLLNNGGGASVDDSLRADSVTMLPSIMPDEFADNHRVELEACMRWFSSDAGQVAKIEAPAGYANVRAHAMLHKSYLLKQQGALLQHPATLLPPRK